ncbi:MAG: hypothetical protein GX100_12385 [candidate division WS1 bacterium]|nr:hypothetical protein [candidate division WS1 bacterium]
MHRHYLLLAVLAVVALSALPMPGQAAPDGPALFWYSDPVKPGEVALLQGDQIAERCQVEFLRLADGDPGQPQAAPAAPSGAPTRIAPLQASVSSVKFEIPTALKEGIYATRVAGATGQSSWVYLNSPQVWWQQGDFGAEASPGGWLRVFGRCLSFNDQARAALRQGGKTTATLKPSQQECWSLTLDLPQNLARGDYEVWVHNGFGGPAGWRRAGQVTIQPHELFWKTDRFDVADYGGIPDDNRDDSYALQKALTAAAENGGGTVYLGRGRWDVAGGFTIPPHVLLQGVARQQTLLEFQDTQTPPDALLSGTNNFAIQDLSINAINHKTGIKSAGAAQGGTGNVWIQRVGLHMDRTMATWNPEVAKARRAAPAGPTIIVSGENCQILDCEVYSDGEGCRLQDCTYSLFARNNIYEPLGAWSYPSGKYLIWEDNSFTGDTNGSHGEGIYFARNTIRHMYHGFRELMTTDTGGGSYVGKLASINGTEVTLADEVKWGWPENRNCLVVMSGKGMGQYRLIVKREGNKLTLDRPFELPPDEESVVAATVWMNHLMWIDNSMSDGSVAVSLYGTAYDCVAAGNTAARSTGFHLLGFNYGGPAPEFYIQLLDNRILEGYGMKGPGAGDGWSAIALRSDGMAQVRASGAEGFVYRGPMIRGVVVRNNVI